MIRLADSDLERLVPGTYVEGTDGGGDVSTSLTTPPSITEHVGYRIVQLHLVIANNDGPGFTIKARYKLSGHRATAVAHAGCMGIDIVPARIEAGASHEGCMGFSIPRGPGKLLLTGSPNFSFYIPVGRS